MTFWVSFLPEAHRKLRPDGIHLHGIPYWSNVLTADVGRVDQDVMIKYDPRDVSRIFVQRPSGHFIEARTRNLAFPSLTLREWTVAQHRRRASGRAERDTDQLHRTALAQRRIIDEAIRKTAQARHQTVLHGSVSGRSEPTLACVQAMRTDFGRPSSSMQFRTMTATFISVA
jgi:putative transposase